MVMDVQKEWDRYGRGEGEGGRGVDYGSWLLWLEGMGAYEELAHESYDWLRLGEKERLSSETGVEKQGGVLVKEEKGVQGGGPHGEGGYDSERLALELVKDCGSLEEVERALASFSPGVLEELQGGATNLVYVDGVAKAEVLVIGEAPGRDEDREGRPFVGRSGRLLDKILGSVGLSREKNVLLSNVVYWRPPGNRNPTRSEVMACRPFVEKTIELVRPDFIVLTGGVPVGALLQTQEAVGRLRGKWSCYRDGAGRDYEVLVTFHPSYLLRSPKMKVHAWRDMVTLKKRREEKGEKG